MSEYRLDALFPKKTFLSEKDSVRSAHNVVFCRFFLSMSIIGGVILEAAAERAAERGGEIFSGAIFGRVFAVLGLFQCLQRVALGILRKMRPCAQS